eukprot:jgi/Bigna1/136455/aug1.34_g11163
MKQLLECLLSADNRCRVLKATRINKIGATSAREEEIRRPMVDARGGWGVRYNMRIQAQARCGYEEKLVSKGQPLKSFNIEGKDLFQSLRRHWKKGEEQVHHDNQSRHSFDMSLRFGDGSCLEPVRLLGIGPLKLVMEYRNNRTGESCAIKSYIGPISRISRGYDGYVRLCRRERGKLQRLKYIDGFVSLKRPAEYSRITMAFGWPCLIEEVVPGISLSEGRHELEKLVNEIAEVKEEEEEEEEEEEDGGEVAHTRDKQELQRSFEKGGEGGRSNPTKQSSHDDDGFVAFDCSTTQKLKRICVLISQMTSCIHRAAITLQECEKIGLMAKWDKEHVSPLDMMLPGTFLDPAYVTDIQANLLKLSSELLSHKRRLLKAHGVRIITKTAQGHLEKLRALHIKGKTNQTVVQPSDVLDALRGLSMMSVCPTPKRKRQEHTIG